MITGRRAFHEDTDLATLAAVIAKEPASARQFAPELTPVLERIVDHCLRKKREDRWQSMEDVKLLLASALADLDVAVPADTQAVRAGRRSLWRPAPRCLRPGATWWWLRPADTPAPIQVLRQVTNSGGLNDYPALSRDGNLLAFASDRSEAGNLDIWSQQVGGREPIRLTTRRRGRQRPGDLRRRHAGGLPQRALRRRHLCRAVAGRRRGAAGAARPWAALLSRRALDRLLGGARKFGPVARDGARLRDRKRRRTGATDWRRPGRGTLPGLVARQR